jgi:Tol biopolymer transport system component
MKMQSVLTRTKGPMTPEEILTLKVLTDSQVSPDGSLVTYVVSDNYKEEGTARPHSNIWISDSRGGNTRQFSSGARSDYMPRWSHDGSRIVFLSDRVESGKFQIYLLSTTGGEAIQLTDYKGVGEIMQIEWSRSGEKIAFLMYDPQTDEDRKRFEESGGAVEYEKRHKYARIHVMDVSSKKIEWQSTGDYHIWEFSWSPDELSFAAVVARRAV